MPQSLRLFLRYCLAGIVSFLVDFSLYAMLTKALGWDPLLANPLSRAAGGIACFLVNRRFTFPPGSRSMGLQFSRFWVVFFVSMMLSELLLGVFYRGFGLDSLAGKLLTEGILLVFNFLGLRHWVYR